MRDRCTAFDYQGEKSMKSILFSIAIVLALISYSSFADDSRDEKIQFLPNTTSTTIKESITGYETVNYQLDAKAGQLMEVDLKTDNTATYFNIFVPGKGPGDQAMYIGSIKGGQFEGKLPADGKYTVQVYMMRSAARRNETANYTLDISIEAAQKSQKSTNETDYEAVDIGNFNKTVQMARENNEEWASDPVMVSLLFTEAMDSKTQTIVRNYPSAESRSAATVLIAYENLLDDSVSGVKYKIDLKKNENGTWNIESVGKAVKCWEGRGHTDYSAKPCS
jgi:hypothetical protein